MIHILGKEKPYQAGEDYFQKAVARFIWFKYPKLIWFHTPNGGFRNGKEAAKFKDMGVRSGVSDLIFLESRMNYNGLIIELKTKKNEITKNQSPKYKKEEKKIFPKYTIQLSTETKGKYI